jgi:THO complex subunit 4
MANKIDLSLDEIIKQDKVKTNFKSGNKNRGSGKSGAGNGVRKGQGSGGIVKRNSSGTNQGWKSGSRNLTWTNPSLSHQGRRQEKFEEKFSRGPEPGKLSISNLADTVSDEDVEELFGEFGPLKQVIVHYDRAGKSLGTSEIVFERKTDALKALKQYNGIPLDGRPMSIQLVQTESAPPPKTLASRVGPKNSRDAENTRRPFIKKHFEPRHERRDHKRPMMNRGGNRRNNLKPKPTVEDLDAELDAYAKRA